MSRIRRHPFALVVVLQILAILCYVGSREWIVQRGREYFLDTRPVDPRDILRGDYVALRFGISNLAYCCYQEGDTIYVLLEDRNGVMQAAGHEHSAPKDGQPFMRGQVTRVLPGSRNNIEVTYGIESYFVPEGQGREIERALAQPNNAVRARIRVDAGGSAIITGLTGI